MEDIKMKVTFVCERGDMGLAKKDDTVYTIKATEKYWKLVATIDKATLELKYMKFDLPKFEDLKKILVEQGYTITDNENDINIKKYNL